jgi:arylsulfatase A-like enzyme
VSTDAHDFQGIIGTTVAESQPWWPTAPAERAGKPNVVMVILDDTGWSDFGCFGSEINTPAIDSLAQTGLRYNNFHVTPLCSPTRASLLTGRNHHSVGMRFLADADTGFPNSRGAIRQDVAMLPQILRNHGYGTYLAGKWHLAPLHEITPAGPFQNWPLSRGFDKYYGFMDGCTDQYAPELIQDNHSVTPPSTPGYHLSEDLADHATTFIKDHVTYRPETPFYLQFALGATHAPFQAPRDYIEKYLPVFAKGWDTTRAERLERQKALGVIPADTILTEPSDNVRRWDELSGDEREVFTHLQAAFAGFLEHADAQIGRVLETLETLGLRENTIVLVMSDNGASREGGPTGDIDCNAPYSGISRTAAEQLDLLPVVGTAMGPAHYPEGWAMAGNTPFRRYKQFVDLGGVRSPLVVSWPAGIDAIGGVRNQFVHAIDITPTLLDLAGIEMPDNVDGASLRDSLTDAAAPARRDTQFWEMLGHRAIWHKGWKAVTEHVSGEPFDTDKWRLYNGTMDFSESIDMAEEFPEKVENLKAIWWNQAHSVGAFPLDDRTLYELLTARGPSGLINRKEIVLRPGQSHVPFSSAIAGSDRSMEVNAYLTGFKSGTEGVLLSSGNVRGGYVLYIRNGTATFEHNHLGTRVVLKSDAPVPEGDATVGFRLTQQEGRAATVELFQQGTVTGRAVVPQVSGHLSFWGMDVGADPVSTVSADYAAPFAMAGNVLDRVVLRFDAGPDLEDLADLMASTE